MLVSGGGNLEVFVPLGEEEVWTSLYLFSPS